MERNEEESRNDQGYDLMAAAFAVYNELGPGFLEEVYQEALEMVLDEQNTPFISKPHLDVWFRDQKLQKHYEADFLIEDQIVVELKAVRTLTPEPKLNFSTS
ncbi:MAG TPA: GxxExxY protein [Rariglobus sp.]|jgi:GxxExxY protein|nr:GxxExxY protein [Rariglobus sp.]